VAPILLRNVSVLQDQAVMQFTFTEVFSVKSLSFVLTHTVFSVKILEDFILGLPFVTLLLFGIDTGSCYPDVSFYYIYNSLIFYRVGC
jgi:hypothetical protein